MLEPLFVDTGYIGRLCKTLDTRGSYDAPFDLEPLDRASLIARVQELHQLVTQRLASAESC
jgi:hypothetical protein